MGNDWEGKFDFLKELCEVEYLERTPDISSTEIKRILNKLSQISFEDLKRALDILSKIDYKELGEAINILKNKSGGFEYESSNFGSRNRLKVKTYHK